MRLAFILALGTIPGALMWQSFAHYRLRRDLVWALSWSAGWLALCVFSVGLKHGFIRLF